MSEIVKMKVTKESVSVATNTSPPPSSQTLAAIPSGNNEKTADPHNIDNMDDDVEMATVPLLTSGKGASTPFPASPSKGSNIADPPVSGAEAIWIRFRELMSDPKNLDFGAEYLYEQLIDDAVLAIYIEEDYLMKTGALKALEGEPEDDSLQKIVDMPNFDIFGNSTVRKAMNCTCPSCERLVAASRFAPHLKKCILRQTTRRGINNKECNSNYFVSDNDDDADWSNDKRKKKIQSSRSNAPKKNGKNS